MSIQMVSVSLIPGHPGSRIILRAHSQSHEGELADAQSEKKKVSHARIISDEINQVKNNVVIYEIR